MSRIGTSIDVPTCLYINISIISIKPPQEIGEPMHKQMRYNRNALERGMDETRNDIIDSRSLGTRSGSQISPKTRHTGLTKICQ